MRRIDLSPVSTAVIALTLSVLVLGCLPDRKGHLAPDSGVDLLGGDSVSMDTTPLDTPDNPEDTLPGDTPVPPEDVPVEDTPPDNIDPCGDDECDEEGGETCETCPLDCGQCGPACGDGTCVSGDPPEDPDTCPEDCGSCGDGVCGSWEVDDASYCHKDCAPACGNGTCEPQESGTPGGTGYCPVDCGFCDDGVCGYPDMNQGCMEWDCGAACGDDECSLTESPYACPFDCGAPCGDGTCEAGEDADGCPVDCGSCGDGVCGKIGQQFEDCPLDCVTPCGDGVCSWGETAMACASDCGWCGDGVCGSVELEKGACPVDCLGCGNGACDDGESDTSCPADCGCVPDCSPGWECGPDANDCGQPCGACLDTPEWACIEHVCVCTPACEGKACGDDACGGECGECDLGDFCLEDGTCYTLPFVCNGSTGPSATGCSITAFSEGCCHPDGFLIWCEDGDTWCENCSLNPSCGWDDGIYNCGTAGGADPGAVFPLTCPSI